MPGETPSAPAEQAKEPTLFEKAVATGQAGIEALNKGAGDLGTTISETATNIAEHPTTKSVLATGQTGIEAFGRGANAVGTTISETATNIAEHPTTKGALSTLEQRLNDLKAAAVSAFFGSADVAKKTTPAVKPTSAAAAPSVAPTVAQAKTESSPLLASFTHLMETVTNFLESFTKNNPDSPITRLLQSTGIVDKAEELNQKAEAAKTETPKTETPLVEAPKTEATKVETSPSETPKAEAPKVETAKTETPKTESSPTETPKIETPKDVELGSAQQKITVDDKEYSISVQNDIVTLNGKKWKLVGTGTAAAASFAIKELILTAKKSLNVTVNVKPPYVPFVSDGKPFDVTDTIAENTARKMLSHFVTNSNDYLLPATKDPKSGNEYVLGFKNVA